MFLLNGLPVRDSAPYLAYYYAKGLPTDILSKCNSQEFKSIGGIGEGYFILDSQVYPTPGSTVILQMFGNGQTPQSATLYVLEVIEIEHPSATGKRSRIIHTAEEKYSLRLRTVPKNYNVIHRRTLELATVDANIILGSGAGLDGVALSLEAVLTDASGKSVTNNTGLSIQPYDVFIEGMNAFDAVELLCRANGFLWSMDSESITIWTARNAAAPNYVKMEDIQRNIVTPAHRRFQIVFPVLDCCVEQPIEFYDKFEAGGSSGVVITTYMPFYPALPFTDGTITNESDIIEVGQTLELEFQAVLAMSVYIDYPNYRYFNIAGQPNWITIKYGDTGSGPYTLISGREYPYVPLPTSPVRDRQCKNWVGKVKDGFNADDPPVEGFWVTPEFGLDGKMPVDDTNAPLDQWVVNLYKWDFAEQDAYVRVEWDCINYRWIPLQLEYICPTEDTFPDQVPPDPEEYDPIDYLP